MRTSTLGVVSAWSFGALSVAEVYEMVSAMAPLDIYIVLPGCSWYDPTGGQDPIGRYSTSTQTDWGPPTGAPDLPYNPDPYNSTYSWRAPPEGFKYHHSPYKEPKVWIP